jgi:integrase
VTAINDAQVLPKVKAKPKHHSAMPWQAVPAFYADLKCRDAMAAQALKFTCLTGSRTGEVLGMKWEEVDQAARLWTCPADRMKGGVVHRVPLTDEMLEIISVSEAVRQIGVTVQTYYRWRKDYGGMSRDQLKRLKELETENARLKRVVADLSLDKLILSEAARGNF